MIYCGSGIKYGRGGVWCGGGGDNGCVDPLCTSRRDKWHERLSGRGREMRRWRRRREGRREKGKYMVLDGRGRIEEEEIED